MSIGKDSPVKCIAPWNALCIKADGKVVPDIQFRGTYGNINDQPMEKILGNEVLQEIRQAMARKEFHAGCRNCQLKENSGGRSRRTFFYDVLFEKIEAVDFSVSAKPDIHLLEINTSNKCNLKCRMCSGSISSAWVADEKSLLNTAIDLQRPKSGYQFNSQKAIDNLFSQPQYFRNLRHLALRGGEPLYEEANLYIFEKIEELGLTQQIHLDISTNATVVSDKILSALQRFGSIEIYVSLEGVSDVYQYIRGGKTFSLSDLEQNIKKLQQLPNVTLVFTFLSMVYNLQEINPFWNWYQSVRQEGDEVSLSNIVANPEYLSFHILPREIKRQHLEIIQSGPIPKGEYDTGKRILRDVGVESLLSGLEKENYYEVKKLKTLQAQFKCFNERLDEIRGTSLNQILPHLSDWYNSLPSPHERPSC